MGISLRFILAVSSSSEWSLETKTAMSPAMWGQATDEPGKILVAVVLLIQVLPMVSPGA